MQTKDDSLVTPDTNLQGLTMSADTLVAYQKKKRDFPGVFIKHSRDGKVHITGKQQQETLVEGTLPFCSNLKSGQLQKEKTLHTLKLAHDPYIKIQRLSAEEMQRLSKKTPTAAQPISSNNPKVLSNKADLKSKHICTPLKDLQVDNDADLFSTSAQSTKTHVVTLTKDRKKCESNKLLHKCTEKVVLPEETTLKFNQLLEHVLENTNNNDLSKIGDVALKDNDLLNRSFMEQLVDEAAQLKASGTTKLITIDKILSIFSVVELNLKAENQISLLHDVTNNIESTGQLERILWTADACLLCLHIMTSPNMPKRIYLEDMINRVVMCIKNLLQNDIFSASDITNCVKSETSANKKLQQTLEDLEDKILHLIILLTEFLNIQVLIDALVLEVSSMAVSSFFAENITKLQPACLQLITAMFLRYEKHRRLTFEFIVDSAINFHNTTTSLSKEKNRLLTELVLHLIQCVTIFPEDISSDIYKRGKAKKINKDRLIHIKYQNAIEAAGTFLTLFLNRCNKSEDADHKHLFKNFIQNLTSLVNNPKWPASVLLLNVLGRTLVKMFSDKGVEIHTRVTNLEYLGLVVAWLRRSAIVMQGKVEEVDRLIKHVKELAEKNRKIDSNEEKLYFLQEVLLDFLAQNDDQTAQDSRYFYIAQWYDDLLGKNAYNSKNESVISKNNLKRKRGEDGTDVSNLAILNSHKRLEPRKKVLLNKLKPQNECMPSKTLHANIDRNGSELIIQYFISECNSLEVFNQYIKAILMGLKDPVVTIRTSVSKCFSLIFEADPKLLARNDIQLGLKYSFLDSISSVREATIDLVGKFLLRSPELLDLYYEQLLARILDTSVGVRKRIIRILRDICTAQPDSLKVPEICTKIMRRVNDAGGVGKIVVDVFQSIWFTPETKSSLSRRVQGIVDVVAASQDIGLVSFEQLLQNLFKPNENKFDSKKVSKEPPRALLLASTQIVDCLMENMVKVMEMRTADSNSSRSLASYSTILYLFTKTQPKLLVKHAEAMQLFLNLKCYSKEDVQVVSDAAQILTLIVPLIPNVCQTFLTRVEQDCVKLAFQHGGPVMVSSVTCLGSIINYVTHNFNFVRYCLKKYYDYLVQVKLQIASKTDENLLSDVKYRQFFKRALLFVGLLFRHFDFANEEIMGELPERIIDEVFEVFLYFLQQDEEDIQTCTVIAIGSICARHYDFMMKEQLKTFYQRVLTSDDVSLSLKSEVLLNIESYLREEDQRMMKEDLKWKTRSKAENLKILDDTSSSMVSTVIQQYLKQILESYLHPNIQVRKPALVILQLILQQGLVNPVQIVPYLICMSTDCETSVSHGADKQLLELEGKLPGLINTKSSLGIKLSYRLQKIIQKVPIIRGFRSRDPAGEYPTSFNGYLYSIIRSSRQQRRGMVLNMLKQFDEEDVNLSYMLYLADTIAYFTYVVQDEPLFIIHHIDMMVTVSGTNLLQLFREGLNKTVEAEQQLAGKDGAMKISALDEDDDQEELLARLPEDTSTLQEYLVAAQGCLLLLLLKKHLKDVYDLNDCKIQQYSPTESAKINDKPLNRRNTKQFNPVTTISKLQEDCSTKKLDEEGRKNLINQYLEFKQLMLQLDHDENDKKTDKEDFLRISTSPSGITTTVSASNSILIESGRVKLSTEKKQTPRKSQTPNKSKTPKLKKKRRKLAVSSDNQLGDECSDSDFVP